MTPQSTTTYALVAVGSGGTVTNTATVNVNVPPPPPPPPTSTLIYSQDYESGLGSMGLYSAYGQCSATSGSVQARSLTAGKTGAGIEQHYNIALQGVNGCADHQDANMPIEYVLPGGKTGAGTPTICRKEDYYFVTPSGRQQIQRKLMWLKAGQNPTSGNAMWDLVLTSDGSPITGRPSVRFAYQDAQSHGYSLYGGDADPGFVVPDPTAYNGGIMELDYERWYTIEFCATRKTPGQQDAKLQLFVDGIEVFRKTQWAPPSPGARTAFPYDDFNPSNFTWTWGGQQTDRIATQTDGKPVDEFRRIDNTRICAGRCPQ